MWLDNFTTTGTTAVSLVVLLYFAQIRGWIYFKPQVDAQKAADNLRVQEARDDRDARVAEAREDKIARIADKDREIDNLWAALNASEQGKQILAAQNEKMLEGLETAVTVIRAIPTPRGR